VDDIEEMDPVNDDWECENEHLEFVKFPSTGGSYLMVLDKFVGSRENKFGKMVYDFNVRMADNPADIKSWREMKLSISSRKLRAKLTKIKNDGYNNGKFWGQVPVFITWEGENINRWYDASPVTSAHPDYDYISKTLGISPG